jgi:hypothetical protein
VRRKSHHLFFISLWLAGWMEMPHSCALSPDITHLWLWQRPPIRFSASAQMKKEPAREDRQVAENSSHLHLLHWFFLFYFSALRHRRFSSGKHFHPSGVCKREESFSPLTHKEITNSGWLKIFVCGLVTPALIQMFRTKKSFCWQRITGNETHSQKSPHESEL